MKEINLKRALEKINTNEEMDTRIMETILKGEKRKYKKIEKNLSLVAAFCILIVFGTVTTLVAATNRSYHLQASKEIEFFKPIEYVIGENGVEAVIDEETIKNTYNYIDCESIEKAFENIQEENYFPTYIPDDRKLKNVSYELGDKWKAVQVNYTGSESFLLNMDIFYLFYPGQEVKTNENGMAEVTRALPGGEYEEESKKAIETIKYSEYTTVNGLNCLISEFENPNEPDDVTIYIQLESGILTIGITYYDTCLEQEELYKILDSIPNII